MKYVFLIFFIMLLSCTPLKRQASQMAIPEKFYNTEVTNEPHTLRWWREFQDPLLDSLLAEALKNNHDIRIATERVLQARALLGMSRSERFPSIQFNITASRQRQNTMGIVAHTSTFNINLMASYEVDLWGRLSSSERQALANLKAQEETRQVVLQSIVSDVVNLYIHAKALRELIKTKEELLKNAEQNLEIITSRYELGKSSYLEVLQARAIFSEALTQLDPLRMQLKETLYRLSVLLGRYPGELDTSDKPISEYVEVLGPVPPGLPSELLRRRPDLRAAELRAEAAFQALKVARAMRFPVLNLTATGGYASGELEDLFKPESLFWQLSAGIMEPLFQAGRLARQEEAARASYKQAVIEYSKALLQAFYEVERALSDRRLLLSQRQATEHLVKDLQRTYRVALDRYRLGLVDLTTVLQLQRQYFNARANLIQTDESILTNRVFLYRALGGKWTDEDSEKSVY